MSTPENSLKSIFIAEDLSDFVNESQFLKESPKNKKQPKRKSAILEKEIINLVGQTNMNKKKKVNEEIEVCGESRQRILNVMSKQLKSRSHVTDNLLKNLSEFMVHFEADYTILKENVHKLKHFSAVSMKCINQTMAASKQKLRELQEIHSKFKKECEDTDAVQKADMDKLGDELEDDMNKLKQKLISETKRRGWETLRRSFIQAMQNDF